MAVRQLAALCHECQRESQSDDSRQGGLVGLGVRGLDHERPFFDFGPVRGKRLRRLMGTLLKVVLVVDLDLVIATLWTGAKYTTGLRYRTRTRPERTCAFGHHPR